MTTSEWLIADGLGGYAMGTSDGIRTRRYHSLLLAAAPDSERRFVLVNGVEAWLETDAGSVALSSHRYAPDAVHPDGASRITEFTPHPWPSWTSSANGVDVEHEIFGVHGAATTVLHWHVEGSAPAKLRVRPLLSGRDWHGLQRENPAFRFGVERVGDGWRFQPYDGVPPVTVSANAQYEQKPLWFRRFQYDEERARGQEYLEDLASPGEFTFTLTADHRDAWMELSTAPEWRGSDARSSIANVGESLRQLEENRLPDPLDRFADQFVVTRGARRTIVAGYPWFTDWGRDTFIAVRGLCIASGRLTDAESILRSWCDHMSGGMMPNLFPSGAGAPEYNSVDASLWFVVAVRDLSAAMSDGTVGQVPLRFVEACEDILAHYSRGTRHGIHMDRDCLLAAGAPGMALTWMDAIVDGQPVTPRVGKPVEVQALWINALEFCATWNTRWRATAAKARESFAKRFWNEKRGALHDVVDVDHVMGTVDDRVRPNQVFAIGGLPLAIVDGERALSIFDVVQRQLATPAGLRTLAPDEPGYMGRVDGPLRQRDLGYHQGTVWPWLTCAFDDAGLRLMKAGHMTASAIATWLASQVRADHFAAHEIADGDAPHVHRGCPYQAWSVGESIRRMHLAGWTE